MILSYVKIVLVAFWVAAVIRVMVKEFAEVWITAPVFDPTKSGSYFRAVEGLMTVTLS